MNNLKKRDQLILFFSQVALWFFRDPDFMTGWAPAISPGGNGFVKVITSSLKERKIQGVPKNALSECCQSHSALAQSQVAVLPCVWKFIFWSFLTNTKPGQAFQSHVHGKVWPHSTQFLVMILQKAALSHWSRAGLH